MGFRLQNGDPFLVRNQAKLDKFREMIPLSDHIYDMGGPAHNSYIVMVVYEGNQYVSTKISQWGSRTGVIKKLESKGLRVDIVREGLTKADAYDKKEKIQQFFNDRCHLGLTDRERGNKFKSNE